MSAHRPLAWEIFWDTSQLGDDESDARLVRFPGWETTMGLVAPRPLTLPARIFFEANVEALARTDYPSTDVNWPIVSPRMLEVLSSVGTFAHRAIPVVMLDDTVASAHRLDAAGEPRPGTATHGFCALQLLEPIDAFDWERSRYERHPTLPGRVTRIHELVLTAAGGRLPPLFRLAARTMQLFVSDEAREALERAGVRGAVLWPLERTRQ